MKIEFDMDGVLCNLYDALEKRIQRLGYKDYRADNVKRYDMKVSGIGCPKIVLVQNMYDPEIYKEAEPMNFAIELVSWILRNGHEVVINTLCIHEQVDAKNKWLDDFQNHIKDGVFMSYLNEDYGVKRMIQDADICIDGSIDNIRRSPASIRILVKAPHNKPENNRDSLDVFEEAIYVNDLQEIKSNLIELFPKEFVIE